MKKIALAVAVSAIALSTPASAAEWMGQKFDQAYVSVKGGATSVRDDSGYNFETGKIFTAAAGYSAAKNIRAELEGGYTSANLEGPGDINTYTIMANGYYDFTCLSEVITPYVGVGVGTAHHTLEGQGSSWELAYQGIAGASYNINPNVAITAEYRYLGSTDAGDVSYDSHNALVGVKFGF